VFLLLSHDANIFLKNANKQNDDDDDDDDNDD